jgi:hypothetical protein
VPNRAIQPWEPERAAFEVAGVVLAPTSGLQSGPARWPLGSVVDHVARTLPIPVGVPGQVEELQPAAS